MYLEAVQVKKVNVETYNKCFTMCQNGVEVKFTVHQFHWYYNY